MTRFYLILKAKTLKINKKNNEAPRNSQNHFVSLAVQICFKNQNRAQRAVTLA